MRYVAPKDLTLAQFLYGYFDVRQDSTYPLHPRLFAGLEKVLVLPHQIEEAVHNRQSQVPPAEVLLRPLENVKNVFMQFDSLHRDLPSIRAQFTDADVSDLEHCSYYLGAENSSTLLTSPDDLEKIRGLAEDLMQTVLDSNDLDPQLRAFIFDHAGKIFDAVRLARAAGAGIMKSTLDEAIGDLVRNPVLQGKLANEKTAGRKFYELLQALTVAITLVQIPIAITADTVELLEAGNPTSVVIEESDRHGKAPLPAKDSDHTPEGERLPQP